jgi:ribosomal-protein-alanine N-acetyltransferase
MGEETMSQNPRCSSDSKGEQQTKSATSSEEMQCVVCTKDDLDDLVLIEQSSFSDPWTRKMLEETLDNPLCVCAGIKIAGRLVGYASMYHILSEGQILSIAVLPEYRRRGIAGTLFDAFHKYAKDNQMENFYLEVRVSNEAAISFYTKLGFKPAGIRKSYYSSPTEDAMLMEMQI